MTLVIPTVALANLCMCRKGRTSTSSATTHHRLNLQCALRKFSSTMPKISYSTSSSRPEERLKDAEKRVVTKPSISWWVPLQR